MNHLSRTHPPVATTARPRRVGRPVALMVSAVVLLVAPVSADAHGGIDVADGGGGGARIAVQGSAAEAGEVDLATTLTGRGSGGGSKVVYWIRLSGRERSIRVATDRDESGIHHAEIPVAGRGSWQDWDVAAYVTLSTGRELRVTNDRTNPPGPPEQKAAAPESTTTSAAPVAEPPEPTAATPVEDVSGQGDETPGWVVPSIVLLVLAGGVAAVLRHRRLPRDDG
ncbi:hypothetical protein AB0L40_00980 [Patulibacter sp. NPDC049589]|uniref:hypothetical protein n=1 Tax=Patulibacter sp. NPDC049589 TaxID=3154731 RepID=UPI0034132FDB